MIRDPFLTESMGNQLWWCCSACEVQTRTKFCDCQDAQWSAYNFSTWEGFGKLWEWAQEQEWWIDLVHEHLGYHEPADMHTQDPCFNMVSDNFINPDLFANAIYEFLKERT